MTSSRRCRWSLIQEPQLEVEDDPSPQSMDCVFDLESSPPTKHGIEQNPPALHLHQLVDRYENGWHDWIAAMVGSANATLLTAQLKTEIPPSHSSGKELAAVQRVKGTERALNAPD